MINLGDVVVNETISIPFNTFDRDGASATVTDLVASDVEIHKDGSDTQRASDSGVTVLIDFDTVTGNHLITIDLSDNGDDGFYAAGSDYMVRLEGITVDGQTINAWIGMFSIQNRVMRGTDSAALASVCTEARLAELDAANLPTDLATILKYVGNDFRIVGNQLILYDNDGSTPLKTWNLFDVDGNATMVNVFRRIGV